MAASKGRKRQTVWQDIVPVKKVEKNKKTNFLKIKLQKAIKYFSIKKIVGKISTTPKKKLTKDAIIVIFIAFSFYSFYQLYINTAKHNEEISTITQEVKLTRGNPEYPTLLPVGKNIKDLGGWTKVSPPNTDPVYTYVDRIENIQIKVSQQPLPDEFKDDINNQVEQLAKAANASEKITVDNTIIYIGTSSKGPQSLFFSKNELLILIKSVDKIQNDQWAQYISTLQ